MRLKLPGFLSRFRKKAASSEPPATEPLPQSEPASTPTAPLSSLDRMNRWLTLGANLGVLLGLVMLVVEVRQNAALTRTAMEHDGNRTVIDIELSLSRPDMAEVWVKSIRTPEDMTDAEARMVESHLVALLLQWNHLFEMEASGLASQERIEQHIRNVAPFYFGSRFAKNWWKFEEPGWGGTPMYEIAGPIIEDLDENFLADRFDNVRLAPTEPAPARPEETQ